MNPFFVINYERILVSQHREQFPHPPRRFKRLATRSIPPARRLRFVSTTKGGWTRPGSYVWPRNTWAVNGTIYDENLRVLSRILAAVVGMKSLRDSTPVSWWTVFFLMK